MAERRVESRHNAHRSHGLHAFLFTAPAVAIGLATLFLPLAAVIVLAFTDYRLGAPVFTFVGIGNFMALKDDPVFQRSLVNTLLYSLLVVPASIATGLGIALLIDARPSLRALYRTIHFLPVMAATIAMAVVWEFMLNPSLGVVNQLLAGMGIAGPRWLEDPRTALLSLALIGVWQSAGFNMVLFLTGLTAIPRQYREAAAIDGATCAWDRFWLVTWPLLRPITVFVTVISLLHSFQLFETVYVITGGGPQKSTEVLLFTMFSEAFEFMRTGRGAAIAVVFLMLVGAITLAKFCFTSDRSPS